jgi:hypothetical protein
VAICVGTVIAIARSKTNASSPNQGSGTALTLADCQRAHGKQFGVIRTQLEARDLRVTRADTVSDLARNRVEEIVPCPASPGATVTVKVSTGKVGQASCSPGVGAPACVESSND